MSQLNNEEKKSITDELLEKATVERIDIKEEKIEVKEEVQKENTEKMNINMVKNKGNKGLIIFLIIFTIIAIFVTSGLICLENRKNVSAAKNESVVETEETKLFDESRLAINSITEFYSENPIEIEEKEIKYGKAKNEDGEEVYKVNITYPQISGLKNKTVQNKINKEIKNKVLSYYNENILNDNKIDYFTISSKVEGNFGDVISVSIDVYFGLVEDKNIDDTKYKNIRSGLNYRLDTGEQILFRDLFLNTTNMDNIIQKYVYNKLLEQIKYDTEEEEDDAFVIDYLNADYTELENKITSYIRQYRKEGIKYFFFTPRFAYFGIGDIEFYIELDEINTDIAIYKRFLTKSMIYENIEKEKQNLFVFTEKKSSYLKEGQYLDNLYMEVYSFVELDGKYIDDIEKENEIIDKFYKKYIDIAKKNPDKAFVIQGDFYISSIEGTEIKQFDNNYSYTTMSKEYYDKKGKEVLLELMKAPRSSVDGGRFYEENSNNEIKVEVRQEHYYIDNEFNRLKFMDIQKQFGNMFSKENKLVTEELPKITYQNNIYIYDYTNLGGEIQTQEVTTENIRNKKINGLKKVDSYDQKEFEGVKEEIRRYLKEELNIDVTNSLKQLEIKESDNVDTYDYWGGYYILKGNNYDGEMLRTAIFKYLMTQSNTSSDSIFVDSNGKEQNKVIKQTLAEQLAKHCCTVYGNKDIQANDRQLLITKLLLEMYGENLLKDALTGRKSVIEQDILKSIDETTYDGAVYALDNYYLGDSLNEELVTTYLTMINNLQVYKDYTYNVFN